MFPRQYWGTKVFCVLYIYAEVLDIRSRIGFDFKLFLVTDRMGLWSASGLWHTSDNSPVTGSLYKAERNSSVQYVDLLLAK